MGIQLKNLFLFASVLFVTVAKAQLSLNYFNLIEDKTTVLLRWQMAKGNSCNGIHILRSTDNIQFNEIGVIFGICGSQEKETSFEYRDSMPVKNSINYYKLDLGGNGFSAIEHIDIIDYSENDYQIRYNSSTGLAQLLFLNPNNENWQFNIYNANGKLVHQQNVSQNKVELKKFNFPSGTYVFNLINEITKKNISGKIVFY